MEQRVLFVDDDKRMVNAIRRSVRHEDWHKLFAGSAEEAMSLMDKEEVAVLVTDISMPEVDGVQLMKEVSQRHPKTVLIALTGVNDLEDVYNIFNEVEPFRYITKPWESDELTLIIKEALEEWSQSISTK